MVARHVSPWRDMAECESTISTSDSESVITTLDADMEGSSTSDGHRSLLEVLKAPRKSDLARKRCIAHNLPHDGKRHKAPKRSHDPKGVSPAQRVKEFVCICE